MCPLCTQELQRRPGAIAHERLKFRVSYPEEIQGGRLVHEAWMYDCTACDSVWMVTNPETPQANWRLVVQRPHHD